MTDEILWTDELETRVAAIEATFVPRPAETPRVAEVPPDACKIWCSGGNLYLEYETDKGRTAQIHIPRNRAGIEALFLTLLEKDKRRVKTQVTAHALFMALNEGDWLKNNAPKRAKPLRVNKPTSITLAQLGLVKPSEINLKNLGLVKDE